ncbi:hypothetical protein MASR1M66_18540 [Aminivibrio sp.]
MTDLPRLSVTVSSCPEEGRAGAQRKRARQSSRGAVRGMKILSLKKYGYGKSAPIVTPFPEKVLLIFAGEGGISFGGEDVRRNYGHYRGKVRDK